MKVTGPNSGPGAGAPDAAAGVAPEEAGSTHEVGEAGASSAIGRTEGSGRAFAEKLAAAGSPPGAAARPAELNPTEAIATDLHAGRLTPSAAVDRILEQVLEQQVGADAPAAVRERVRAALQDALENDPLLAEKLRRLGA